ncbi:MAG: SGNH/GDSL hydrolase family protein [Lachnospiraceae bacterium]|jgi:hypothetical protein|nr:SGNH/GDSL hydrolase family protein [Lachnospiraceae bacterium]MCH4066240.1 SGNH/GDSL hydrolase family protein [Lachnospiraceae bacterium]
MQDNRDNLSEQSRAEQSRAEQSRAEQSRAEQSLDKLTRSVSFLRVLVICLIVTIIVAGLGAGYCGYKLYRKVQGQADAIELSRVKINTLEIRMEELSPSLDDEAKTFLANCDDDHYNILFIGNSITRHEITSYWWSDGRGMAATSQDTDYVHQTESLLTDKLEELKPGAKGINGYAFNYSVWETNAHDRAQTYPVMDKYMTEGGGLDVVVLQLGENVSDASTDDSTYESDYAELIQHIKEEAPFAQIITVGDFWADDTKDAVKKSVAEEVGVTYVDLAEIQDDPNYEAGMGTTVQGDDGNEHEIDHSGVAKHPGDTGMKWIAKKIVDMVEK